MPRYEDDEYDDYEERRPRRSRSRRNTGDYSGFVKAFIIMDLIFCLIRIPLVLFGVIGMMSKEVDLGPLKNSAVFEVGTGIAMALLGLIANGLLLMRNPMGVVFGWMALVATGGSILVGIWQVSIQLGMAPDEATKIGMMVGGGMAVLIRVGLNAGYAMALTKVPEELGQG